MFLPDLGVNADLNGALPFTADSVWNTRVDGAPLLWNSAQIIAAINPASGLHPDFGSGLYDGIEIGIPYVVVDDNQALVAFLNTLYASEADHGLFPIPDNAPVQGQGATDYNDHHLIVVQRDPTQPNGLGMLYEFFQVSKAADGTWQGYASAFDMNGGDFQRPMGWTSATAAGLPIFPGLLKYDEVQQAIEQGGDNGYIHHALAFTLNSWNIGSELFGAAEHATGGDGAAGFGMHFRLSQSFTIDPSMSPVNKVILNTLKVYGMILIDNGANFFLSGVPDERWDNSDLHQLQVDVHGYDFEVVDSTALHPPVNVVVGSGPDALVLKMSADAYQGSAKFTVSVDGAQVGGIQTVAASDARGQVQSFTFRGDWDDQQHAVTVNFINGLADADGARSLYVKALTYDGVDLAGAAADLHDTGSVSFRAGQVPTFGAGHDTLVLRIAEDAFQGDAQFTVTIDGTRVGGVQTAATLLSSNRFQEFAFLGDWGGGEHTVTVDFLNDLHDVASGGDRNLYVRGLTYNGVAQADGMANLYSTGAASLHFGASGPIGAGQDSLVLLMAEDAFQGDARFTVLVDGVQVGGVQTASMLLSTGKTQAFTFLGDWGGGQHAVVVNFLNDLSDPVTGGDRNLFVRGISYNGVGQADGVANLYSTGATSFLIGTAVPIGSGADTLVLRMTEDAYLGDAQFTVSVDGVQLGGVHTSLMYRSSGKAQDFTFLGDWGAGPHVVTIDFLNGYSDADGARHLFACGMSYNGLWYGKAANLYASGRVSLTLGTA